MNYWITTHWPPFLQDKPTLSSPDPQYHYRVYLPDGREEAGQEMMKGDYVFIYESKTGRPLRNGRNYAYGRQSVIALVRTTSPIQEKSDEEPEEYADGSIICWKWQAETQEQEIGFCSRVNVCRALGYREGYTFRGFGDKHSGLKKLSKKQYEALLACFRASH